MRVRWSEHEARGALNAWQKSGLTLERFAKARGFVPERLRRWQKKLEGTSEPQSDETSPMALLPVQLASSKRGEPVAVHLRSGHVIKVGRGFDEDVFKRVVDLLEEP